MRELKVGDWYYNKYFNTLHQIKELIVGHPIHDNVVKWVVVGDWQIDLDKLDDKFELWKPAEGDWCWFWADKMSIPLLGELIEIVKDTVSERPDSYRARVAIVTDQTSDTTQIVYMKFCEPYLGELPNMLKDK